LRLGGLSQEPDPEPGIGLSVSFFAGGAGAGVGLGEFDGQLSPPPKVVGPDEPVPDGEDAPAGAGLGNAGWLVAGEAAG
jgi:hypothetical protein